MIVPEQIARAVRRFAALPAVICGDETLTFAEVESRANRLANALISAGLASGDRVAVLLENSPRCVEVDFALAKAGLVRASINPRSVPKEIEFIVSDTGARAVIFGATYADGIASIRQGIAGVEMFVRVEEGAGGASAAGVRDYETLLASAPDSAPAVRCKADDLYCLTYTSGTTGKPKGVMVSHQAMVHVANNLLLEMGPRAPGEKILLVQPMSHGAGFFLLPWFMRGGCAVIMRHFDPDELLDLVVRHRIETVKLIPTMLQRILRLDRFPLDLPWLRQMIYGASPMPAETLRDAIRKFGLKMVQVYGQSEAPITLTVLPASDHDPSVAGPARFTSAGVPWTTVEMRVVDEAGADMPAGEAGEVIVRAPHLMSGYWKRPDLTRQVIRGGWLHTRDFGRLDAEGYLHLIGRTDEMIISGGYNIAPREVEEALYLHPAIQEAAVVGEPDAEWGSAVVAYVVLRHPVDDRDLLGFVKEHIGFKAPKRIYRLAELPKNTNGKIAKTVLKPDLAVA